MALEFPQIDSWRRVLQAIHDFLNCFTDTALFWALPIGVRSSRGPLQIVEGFFKEAHVVPDILRRVLIS